MAKIPAIRKRARLRDLKMMFRDGLVTFTDAGSPVFSGTADEASAYLDKIALSRGRPKSDTPPLAITGADRRRAFKVGGYQTQVSGGVVRLICDEEVVLATSDLKIFNKFLGDARLRKVRVAKAVAAADAARVAALVAKERRVEERRLRGEERRRRLRERAAKSKKAGHLRPDDPGVSSPDMTPKDYRGLITTEVFLPQGQDGDAALIALWVAEGAETSKASRDVRGKIRAARKALEGRVSSVVVVLSDHDRSSIQRYGASASIVLTAAMLSRVKPNTLGAR